MKRYIILGNKMNDHFVTAGTVTMIAFLCDITADGKLIMNFTLHAGRLTFKISQFKPKEPKERKPKKRTNILSVKNVLIKCTR